MEHDKKVYLIDRLISENWFATEKEALPFIMAGRVSVGNERVYSVREKVPAGGAIRIKEYYKRKYVNKGGLKLEHALAQFNIDVNGRAALDCGASAGGFTDFLVQRGANPVYAVDAGHGQLAGKLLINENVINMERTNLSDTSLARLTPKPDIITLDLSYLSLKKAVPACADIMRPQGVIVALIKPIYEVDSAEIRRSGDINRREVLFGVLTDLCGFFRGNGFRVDGLTHSPVRGNSGALEYFIYLRRAPECAAGGTGRAVDDAGSIADDTHIRQVIDTSFTLLEFNKNDVKNL